MYITITAAAALQLFSTIFTIRSLPFPPGIMCTIAHVIHSTGIESLRFIVNDSPLVQFDSQEAVTAYVYLLESSKAESLM